MLLRLLGLLCGVCLIACSGVARTTAPEDVEPGPAAAPSSVAPGGGSAPVMLAKNVWTETYAVEGRSAAEIRAALNRSGPYSPVDGRRYDAVSAWSLRWSFRYSRERDACRLAAATVEIDVAVRLPELANSESLSSRTLVAWQAYRQALEQHEMGHVERQLAGAEALKERFQAEGAFPTCNELGAALGAIGDAQIAAGRAADLDYDKETEHGRLQGAVFP